MQVFTGFCDTTPYIQLFPGTCKIKASCTIKRLLYTYFDPGLPFVWEFLQSHGWQVNAQLGGITNPQEETAPAKKFRPDGTPYVKQTDGSIGGLLFDTLIEIGGWSDETIFIESLPDGIVDTVENIYKEMALTAEASARADLNYFLEGALGGGSYGSALDNGGGDSGDNNVQDAELQGLDRVYPENGSDVLDPSQVFSIAKYVGFSEKDAKLFRRVAFAESSLTPGLVNSIGCEGLWQIYVKVHPDLVRLHGDMRNPFNNAKAALSLFKSGGMQPWESSRNAGDGGGWGKYRYCPDLLDQRLLVILVRSQTALELRRLRATSPCGLSPANTKWAQATVLTSDLGLRLLPERLAIIKASTSKLQKGRPFLPSKTDVLLLPR